MKPVPGIHVLVVVWGYLEILLFAGVIFGWHSLVYVYKDEGYFSKVCDTSVNSTSDIPGGVSHSQDNITHSVWTNTTQKPTASHLQALQEKHADLTCSERLTAASSSSEGLRVGCKEQDQQFSLIFALSTLITGVLCILNGYLYDHLGTRFTRCISILCYVVSLICLTSSSPDNSYLLYPGFILQSYGGYIILITNMQLAGLVPRFRSTLITLCSGCFDSSAAIFLLFKLAHEGDIRINYCFAFQMCLFTLVIASTIFVHRKSRFPWPLPANYKFQFTLCKYLKDKKLKRQEEESQNWSLNENGSMVFDDHLVKDNPHLIDEKNIDLLLDDKTANGEVVQSEKHVPPIVEVLKSPLFLWNLEWMCFQRLRSWFFVGIFNSWMTQLACGDKDVVSHYTSFFAMVQFIGVFTSPMSGRLMDRRIPAAQVYGNPRYARLHASIASYMLCCGLSLVFSICVAIPVIELQYLSCILHSINRSFIYGPNFAFSANAYPIEHFGKVTGVLLTVSAIFGMLQYPLFLLIQGPLNNDPLVVNVLFIVMMLLSFGHPVYIWNFLRKERQKIERGRNGRTK